jgi:hypothetical protein
MNYAERTFEIDNQVIKFKNPVFIVIMIGSFISMNVFGFLTHSRDSLYILFWLIGSILGILIALYVFGLSRYVKNKILLSAIDYVQVENYKSGNGKALFTGTGKMQNVFPVGFNKKKADKLVFIHQKNKMGVNVFAPENCKVTIQALKENGIHVIEK